MKTWLIRTIPPRPTFHKDATVPEQDQMNAHYLYWKDLFDRGVCLFGGPVFDAKGVYGLLAIATESEAEARALAEADPSVTSRLNRVEVAEMNAVFLQKTS